ncbi:aminotransferase class V-fold PLP-dependent enzyme [Streptomyces sp. NPDC005529]|uniref:aminotransferase class V-fold PLP-dependent enzyme n=1 Tax=unclassified Streptomyces TaxID=2593676 RepID=UPI0033AD8D8D
MTYDVTDPGALGKRVRTDFPILQHPLRGGNRLVYLDSAATTQRPRHVLDAERNFYEHHNAAAHRGAHQLSAAATHDYEQARGTVAAHLHRPADEVVFTKNTTEAINLVAQGIADRRCAKQLRLRPGADIVVSEMEHHANLIPWQQACQRSGARLRWFPLTDDGRLCLDGIEELVTERTALVAVTAQSNVLGTVNPVRTIAARAHSVGAKVLVDGAQWAPHRQLDLDELGADFLAFLGHKMCGPSNIGVLWGRRELLETLPPLITGGSIIEDVTMTTARFRPPPHRFEAGVPGVAQAVGLAAAFDYLGRIGWDNIAAHEEALTEYALRQMAKLPDVTVIGPDTTKDRGGVIALVHDRVPARQLADMLDTAGVAVRVGHHCARPLHARYGLPATVRASFYLYNTYDDVDALVNVLHDAQQGASARDRLAEADG